MDVVQKEIVSWGIFGTVAVVGVYAFIKWGLPGLANAAKAASQSTDADGNPIDYSDGGGLIVGPLAAGFNKLSGGNLASFGEDIGGGLFSIFGAAPTGSSTYYSVVFPDGSSHSIGNADVDQNSRFSYGGNTWILGDDGFGNKIATAVSTVYGSGSGGVEIGDTLDAGLQAGG
jgi:hypothetical protein